MAQVEILMPKMGESITEATIVQWHKKVGELIAFEETLLEISTDKVDSEIPSSVEGTVSQILFEEGEVVEVGKVIAIVITEGAILQSGKAENNENIVSETTTTTKIESQSKSATTFENSDRFYSPLVKSIAVRENISIEELDSIKGSGAKNRVNKADLLEFIKRRDTGGQKAKEVFTGSDNIEIIEMDRMRQMIADHMVKSKQISPHVTSFLEVDVSNIVKWRNSIKVDYQKKYGEKITFTPVFIEAVAKAIQDFPMINASVDGKNILVKRNINIGMATALPSGNLIVPVVKNADHYNIKELARKVNELAKNARTNKLKPEDVQDGTFTLTNVGTFGNTMGTPIINQPQVAILSTGAINKKPAVVETEYGDVVAVRHKMFLSLSYDHRIVDGKLGGSFLRSVGDYLEGFDKGQEI